MKEWIRANTVLAIGVALPVALVLLFSVAAVVPRLLVEPPKHDLLFFAHEYGQPSHCEYRFRVVDRRLRVEARARAEQRYPPIYHLYRFDAATLGTSEIPLPDPELGEDEEKWQLLEVDGVKGLTLDSSDHSPDGYRVTAGRRSGGILTGMFSSGNEGTGLAITRNGRTVVIPANSARRGYNNATFLGWVMGED